MAEDNLWRWQHAQAHIAKPPVEAETFAHMPGWLEDDHCAALACYLRSVDLANAKLPKPAGDTLAALLMDRGKARQFFEENFVPFQILAEPGLLTSYFQPVLKGSRRPSPAFPIPVYRRPADLRPCPLAMRWLQMGLLPPATRRAASSPTLRELKSRRGLWPRAASKSFISPTRSKPSSCTSRAQASSNSMMERKHG